MARHDNNPISHCPKGQGGRTFSKAKPGNHADKAKGSERLKLRQKCQPKPSSPRERFPLGKYYDWANDPEGKRPALIAMNKRRGV